MGSVSNLTLYHREQTSEARRLPESQKKRADCRSRQPGHAARSTANRTNPPTELDNQRWYEDARSDGGRRIVVQVLLSARE